MLRIPLDIIVLIAEKCVKKDFKTVLKFACCCKKLYNKPYIKKEYLKAKRTLVKNFLEKIRVVDSKIYIILNVNGIEEKIDRYKEHDEYWFKNDYSRHFDQNFLLKKIFYIFWKSQWRPKNNDWGIAVNNNIKDFNIPFLHISERDTQYKPIKRFFWTEWAGLTKINIEFLP